MKKGICLLFFCWFFTFLIPLPAAAEGERQRYDPGEDFRPSSRQRYYDEVDHPGHSGGLEVTLTSPNMIETRPGNIITASFVVLSSLAREEHLFEGLTLPPDWQMIIPQESPLTIKAGEHLIRLITFLVPATCQAGRYKITYFLQSRRDYDLYAEISFSVIVLPVIKLETVIEKKPQVVIAGDTGTVALRLVNKGNSGVTIVRLEPQGNPDFPISMESFDKHLARGESRPVIFQINTGKKLNRRTTFILTWDIEAEVEVIEADMKNPEAGGEGSEAEVEGLEAEVEGLEAEGGGIEAESMEDKGTTFSTRGRASFEIIPRLSEMNDPYYTLPSQLQLIQVAEQGASGFQVELSGSGTLDEGKKSRLEYLLRGPDIQDKGSFGKRDEYLVSYRHTFFDVHIGDTSYALSPLTEQYNYGRGMSVHIHPDRLGYGFFYSEKRWSDPEEKQVGTYFQYQLHHRMSLRSNFLARSEGSPSFFSSQSDHMYSLQAVTRPVDSMNLELEYAFSHSSYESTSDNRAYRVMADGDIYDQVHYSLETTYAGPDFTGYVNDSESTYGTLTFPVYQNLRGMISGRFHRKNLDMENEEDQATKERSCILGGNYVFPFGTSISLAYEDFHREDVFLPADYDRREKKVNLRIGQSLPGLYLQTDIERGTWRDDSSEAGSHCLERYSLHGHFRPSSRQTYSLFGRIWRNSSHDASRSIGISSNWRFRNNVHLYLQYTKNNLNIEGIREDDTFSCNLSYHLPNHHTITLKNHWHAYGQTGEEEYSSLLTYTLPMNIPVRRKDGFGKLKGHVFDEESGGKLPLPNVILTVNGATAVTGPDGLFVFPALEEGTYRLEVSGNSIWLNRVINGRSPLTVVIASGKTTEMNVGVVSGGKISGRIVVMDLENEYGLDVFGKQDSHSDVGRQVLNQRQQPPDTPRNGHGPDRLLEVGGLEHVLVECKRTDDDGVVLRQLTDRYGRFTFYQVRPGTWTVTLYASQLPDFHYLEKDTYEIDLKPGEDKSIEAKVLPRRRTIRIIDEGVVSSKSI
ncbi:MAG: hypothetical protein ACMUIA_10125 [bacterium]